MMCCAALVVLASISGRAYAQFEPDYSVYNGGGFSNTPYEMTHTDNAGAAHGFANSVRGNVAIPAGEDFELVWTISRLDTMFWIGLSANPEASASYNMDLAIWHRDTSDQIARSYYNGAWNSANTATNAVDDVFGIKRTGNTIEFTKNGTAFNTISMPIALRNVPLYFDSSWWTGVGSNGSVNAISGVGLVPDVEPASVSATKSVAVWDPQDEGLEPIPGNDVLYTIEVSNAGPGSADEDSMIIIDSLPGELDFYNGDMDDDGAEVNPVSFTQSGGAGLSLTYGTDIAFSDSDTKPESFDDCTYIPSMGYDPSVAHICMNPKGAFAVGAFTVAFRARIR